MSAIPTEKEITTAFIAALQVRLPSYVRPQIKNIKYADAVFTVPKYLPTAHPGVEYNTTPAARDAAAEVLVRLIRRQTWLKKK